MRIIQSLDEDEIFQLTTVMFTMFMEDKQAYRDAFLKLGVEEHFQQQILKVLVSNRLEYIGGLVQHDCWQRMLERQTFSQRDTKWIFLFMDSLKWVILVINI
ncbi:unnamed protein product [Allacma fusca]|uniref:Uncharacterized protein n=1 Tax=Allacma fusca TaxID=39272 RepID=A0A8J2LZ81_9HEXA|nr:unnamed protein product [Allacma fusca]